MPRPRLQVHIFQTAVEHPDASLEESLRVESPRVNTEIDGSMPLVRHTNSPTGYCSGDPADIRARIKCLTSLLRGPIPASTKVQPSQLPGHEAPPPRLKVNISLAPRMDHPDSVIEESVCAEGHSESPVLLGDESPFDTSNLKENNHCA